jgi:hypothetical protein
MRRPPFTPRKITGSVDPRIKVRLEGLGQLKKSNNLVGNRNRDFLLVAQCLNLPRYRAPRVPTPSRH